MHVVGIIAEYNPFHRGHASQLAWIREKLGPDTRIVVALASYFCQRGNPGLQSPRQRAHAAIAAGADLVLLLPQYFSSTAGQSYAQAGVSLLAATDMVRTQAASAEITDKALIQEAARLIAPESPELKAQIRDQIGQGFSPHQARTNALLKLGADQQVVEVFGRANSRLCAEYLAARAQLPTGWHKMGFFLCPRQESSASAGILRDKIEEMALRQRQRLIWQPAWIQAEASQHMSAETILNLSLVKELAASMPQESLSLLLGDLRAGNFVLNTDLLALARILLTRENNPVALASYRDMQGGLAERLLAKADEKDFLASVTARNFPQARIQRALTAYLLGINQEIMDQAGDRPAYLFPLAFNRDGRYILRKMQERAKIPVFSRFSDTANSDDPAIWAQATVERRAAALWAYLAGQSDLEKEILDPPLQL